MSISTEESAVPREGFPRPIPDTPRNVVEQFKMGGKVAVVNGAADGIGYAVAEGFVEAGAAVALLYNSNDAAIQKADALSKTYGVKTAAYMVNATDWTQVQNVVGQIVKDFGKIDVFVANAGAANSKPILEMSLEECQALMSININGVVYCSKAVGDVFKRQGTGNLIITSSISAHIVNVPVDQPVYNGTKAFVSHFGKSLAREWRDFARVNIVSPGFFHTNMGASALVEDEAHRMAVLGRQGDVKEIKGLYLYLASDASTYTTGADILIDGGYTLP